MTEGISYKGIHVVGNSVVDSLNYILNQDSKIESNGYYNILVTCHRRESYEQPLKNLCNCLKDIVNSNRYVNIVWPVHPNSNIKDKISNLKHSSIKLIEPLEYSEFIKLLHNVDLVITDSGGVVEEATVLAKPTIILREETERPEALELDNVRLVGYDFKELKRQVVEWYWSPPKCDQSYIFGTGDTGERIAAIINEYFKGENKF